MNWEFWGEHWFLAWSALWLVWAVVPIAIQCSWIVNRILRAINVALRGWPPEHQDADGDWRPLPKSEKMKSQ